MIFLLISLPASSFNFSGTIFFVDLVSLRQFYFIRFIKDFYGLILTGVLKEGISVRSIFGFYL